VVAGIYILLEQPFRIGDRVTVKDVTGVVQAIELRTTILRTDDALHVVVPNNTMLNEIVTNRSISTQQKAGVRIRVRTTDLGDLQKMGEEISAILANIEGVGETPAPSVTLEGMHEGTARLKLEFWTPTGQKGTITSHALDALRARWPEANMAVVE
jgi:small-conductance mechanosensitive channel